jgi:heavy metal sensor kinase
MRLTLSYLLLFALVLAIVGWLFQRNLRQHQEAQNAAILAEEWGAIRGYLRLDRAGYVYWNYDPEDAEEERIVARLRHVLLLATTSGLILEQSPGYQALGGLGPGEIETAKARRDAVLKLKTRGDGAPFLVRQGILREGPDEFFLAIALPISESGQALAGFRRAYLSWVPMMLLPLAALGWWLAGRALRPVNQLAAAARRISGANLSLRIEPRGAGDEIDALIGSFNQMVERLERSFEQIKRFNVDASHELRTPITAIRGQLEVALFTARAPEEYQEAIATALQDVERMARIVKSLLLLSEAESGQLVLQKARADLGPLVEDIVNQFRISAEEKGMRIDVSAASSCPAVVDRVQFERLVSNLLSNAVKYTPPGGAVQVKLVRSPATVQLTVADNGPGIPARHLPHIFDRFYRVTHSERDPEKGLGLGLSFVDWIVRAHHGAIEVRSEPGQGAVFSVTLPAALNEVRSSESSGSAA